MAIKDQEIFGLIETIGDHYNQNVNNRYLRNIMLHLPLEKQTWDCIDSMIEISDYTRLQGYRFDELYDQIYAMALFISQVRKTILTNMKLYAGSSSNIPDREKILRDMAVSNLGSNLGILADKVNELFLKVIEIDQDEHTGRRTEYEKMPELAEVGRLLVSD